MLAAPASGRTFMIAALERGTWLLCCQRAWRELRSHREGSRKGRSFHMGARNLYKPFFREMLVQV
jgi:hypothetical protein